MCKPCKIYEDPHRTIRELAVERSRLLGIVEEAVQYLYSLQNGHGVRMNTPTGHWGCQCTQCSIYRILVNATETS